MRSRQFVRRGRSGCQKPAADELFFVADVDVERARRILPAVAIQGATDMRVVGTFIGAEADITVDAKEDRLRVGGEWQFVLGEFRLDGVEQVGHRLLQLLFKQRLAWEEPVAIVVAGEFFEKGKASSVKPWKETSAAILLVAFGI